MKFLRNITWDEIYETWRRAETAGDIWRKHYSDRGFKSWEDFRGHQLDQTDLPKREWKLYELQPEEVFTFHCGPFPGWRGLAADMGSSSFGVLSLSPHFDTHAKIQDMRSDFPAEVQLIGIQVPDPDEIRIFEGHHRSVTLCRLLEAGTPPQTKLTIALCEMDELPEVRAK